MTNDLNSLREDKKEVDERIKILELSECAKDIECYEHQDWIEAKIEGRALTKGISVATKLIEDEIKFLKTLPTQSGRASIYQREKVVDRIKYLKGLLE